MPKLTPLKPREVMRKLRKLGFEGPKPGGRHQHMVHPATGRVIPIPIPGGEKIGVGLICEIINEVGITREEWIDL